MKDRVPSLYNDHWWHSFWSQVPGLVHARSCIISTPNRVSSLDVYPVSLMNKYSCMTLTDPWHDTRAWLTMTSLLSLNVKSFKCRKSVQSFNLEVFVKTSTFTDSHRLCRTHKKADFLQVCTQFRFVGRVVFKFMFFFYDTEGGTRWRKEKNRSVVPPTLKVRYLFLIFFFYTNTPMYMECEYIHRYISYVYIYTYIYVCICVCPCIIRYVYRYIYGFRHTYVYMRTWSMYFWRSSHEFERQGSRSLLGTE